MNPVRFHAGSRITALLALSALIVVLPGSTIGLAADPDADGELCVGCNACELGDCEKDDESPLTSHHHCCTTSCMSHVPFALPTVLASPAPLTAETTVTLDALALASRSPETPYRPPRI